MNTARTEDDDLGAQPFVGKGLKFSLTEWAVIARLMKRLNLKFTHLNKAALRDFAEKHDEEWPTPTVSAD